MSASWASSVDVASSVEAAWQWIAPTLRIAELFYSENGLPIEEDLTYDEPGSKLNIPPLVALKHLEKVFKEEAIVMILLALVTNIAE